MACYSSEALGEVDARCARCEVLPANPTGDGVLYLRFPVAITYNKMRRYLNASAWTARDDDGVICLDVPPGELAAYSAALATAFTSVELRTIRALFVERGAEPTMRDYLEVDTLQRLIARSRLVDVATVIEAESLMAAFQPIVDLQTLAIYAHEGLLRLPAESRLSGPGDFFGIAVDTDTLPNADLAARRTIIKAAAGQNFAGNLFINFMPSSIYDAASCLRSTIRALDDLNVAHDRVVFEVVESDEVTDLPHLLDTLAVYRRAGFRVALDDLGSGFASLNLLHALKPDFIKLDLQLVRDVDREPFKATLAAKLIEAGRELQMGVIAEGVETAEEFAWIRDHGATYVQGFYVAKPAMAMHTSIVLGSE